MTQREKDLEELVALFGSMMVPGFYDGGGDFKRHRLGGKFVALVKECRDAYKKRPKEEQNYD